VENTFSIISTAIVLTFILDPFGNVPILLAILKDVDKARHRKIIAREMIFGLVILLFFLFLLGQNFLNIFHLETTSVRIAGGLIFFIIALNLIFPRKNGSLFSSTEEPFIVPIALPMVAGPSALATLLVLSNQHEDHLGGLTALSWNCLGNYRCSDVFSTFSIKDPS
jgi:multiple antibiotic resistance protein